jgi:hypothetical protein
VGESAFADRRRGSRQYVSACVVVLLLGLAAAPAAAAVADPPSAAVADVHDAQATADNGAAGKKDQPAGKKDEPAGKKDDGATGAPESSTAAAGAAKDETAKDEAPKDAKDEAPEDDADKGADKASSEEPGGKPDKEEPGSKPDKEEPGSKPDKEADKGGSVDQSAGASASVDQSAGASASADQKDTGNKHEDVRVDKPGHGPHVDQRNEATADAGANAHADVPESTSVTQDAAADASAAQTGVSNTAVTVRVESPGDNGGVTQANEAAGSAGATTDDGDTGVAAAQASATQDDVSNTNVAVRVFSPGDDGPVSQQNDASATAAAAGGSSSEDASARQDDVRNTNVSIRVESPGTPGQVSQESDASANAGSRRNDEDEDDSATVAVTTDAVDTALSVVVQGASLDRPGALEVWEWTWTWLRDESESTSTAIEAELSSWSWDWDETGPKGTDGRGSVHSRAARADETQQAGTWSWSWDWQRSGLDSWTWQWGWSRTLECGSCIWIWSWSWLWTGTPASDAAGASTESPLSSDNSTAGQINSAQAEAVADVTATIDQVVDQDGEGGSQYAGQIADVLQDANAIATAHQENVRSISLGFTPIQANVVRTEAETLLDADSEQTASQMLGVDGGAGDQWSGQQVEILQGAAADAEASQADVLLTDAGRHDVSATAAAGGSAAVTQQVVQDGLVGGGSLDQWAGQLTLVEQLAEASAMTAQIGTERSRRGGAAARAAATAGDELLIEQTIGQAAVRIAGEGTQEAEQLVAAAQDAVAGATTLQQAGAAGLPTAESTAVAANRAAVVQAGSQLANGTSGFDHQQFVQQSIVVQVAHATSTSLGGLAGTAAVSNCATTEQSASQAIGATGTMAPRLDVTTFCFPAAPPAARSAPFAAAAAGATQTAAEPLIAGAPPPIGRVSVTSSHVAFPADWSSAVPRSARERHQGPSSPGFDAPRPDGSQTAYAQSPVLPSTQARLDTRPGSHAGDGDAGREPPLPPAGDPPMWISALAAAASSTGPSGIAAILLAFTLVPPVVRRAREGSVVRRPATVFTQAEVPV